jgi:predicted nucleic acid-binding protein
MIYFDTNVLVYASVNQDEKWLALSQLKIENAIIQNQFVISPLVLQEFIYVLSKLKIERAYLCATFQQYSRYLKGAVDGEMIRRASAIVQSHNCGKNINDLLHLLLAEKYATSVLTLDRDLLKLQDLVGISVFMLDAESKA